MKPSKTNTKLQKIKYSRMHVRKVESLNQIKTHQEWLSCSCLSFSCFNVLAGQWVF